MSLDNSHVTTVYRHEIKYFMNNLEAQQMRNLMKLIMNKDVYAQKQDYYIRSLYFDTLNNKAFVEKILGINERKKIRLRIYSKDAKEVKLEIKNKYGNYSVKESALLSKQDAQQLISGKTDILLSSENLVCNKVYAEMKRDMYIPQIMIDYEREAYILPFDQIRITFDKNLRCSADHLRQLEADRVFYPVLDRKYMILEVKYNHFLPDFIKRILGTVPGECLSVSKYCLSRQLLV